ncbi:MAG: RDD family protein [Lewinella sp.]
MNTPETPVAKTAMMNVSTPRLMERLKATVVDAMVIVLLMYLGSLLLEALAVESGSIRGALFGLIWLYEPIATSFGKTLGHQIMGIRVRKFLPTPDGNPPRINIFQAIVRFLVKVVLGWVSLLFISSNEYRRAIHDYAGQSVVINVD